MINHSLQEHSPTRKAKQNLEIKKQIEKKHSKMNSMLPSLRSTLVDHMDSFDNFMYDPNYTFSRFKTDVSKDV